MPTPKQPQDRKAKAEAKGADITFAHDGHRYVIPRDRADNVELFEMIEDGKNFAAARAFLGTEQWSEFKNSVRTADDRVPSEPTERFLNALMEALGNSAASPTS